MKWSDGKERNPEEEALLLARQEAFARATEEYRHKELRRLRGSNGWLRTVVSVEKAKAVGAE